MENHQKQFVLSLLAYAVQRDIPAEKLCRLAGFELSDLRNQEDIKFSHKQLSDLWLNAAHLSNDMFFGLHFGESLQLTALGIVGEIVKSSTTVGGAITIAASLTPLLTDFFVMEVTRATKQFTIRLIPDPKKRKEFPFAFQQTLDFFIVFIIHELDGLLLTKIQPKTVKFPDNITNLKEYERILRCRPDRKPNEYSLSFDSKYWDEPILTANYALQKSLLEKVNTKKSEQITNNTFQSRIYNHLLSNAYLGLVSLEEIAANFNISPRTLQRKLKEEGISYQELADDVRKSLALHYLSSGNYYVKEISYMLGYNELSAFSRAFKRWTGTTPGLYPKPN
ncbi:AraC family transcriptional regulator [Dyadobacter diqingensis]|uniref:AraC family transcriptional regulator n=1 Tax=Dyadobacter diqingensis TaxID=2938121 RepID=UPI0020C1AFDA|nr:AraC family transcriptional regulator [Dyadobacter diqingensis]